jgi:glutamyl-tRNA reductase
MSVLVLGLSHKTAPVEVRERLAMAGEAVDAALGALSQRPGIAEACILSTCNRVEFMVRGEGRTSAESRVLEFLGERSAAIGDLRPYLYSYADREAVQHIFRVASSLDSMVVGEPQILGQIKEAYRAAKRAGAVRGPLDQLLTGAFRVARRVRNETGIGQMAVSISYVAVELARKIFGDLTGLSILIVGAGKMSEAAARHLRAAGAEQVWVANRTFERAEELARAFQGEAVAYERLFEILTRADIVISSTGAPHFILNRETAERVIVARRNKPVFFVDIAVPRDIDPKINEIDNMFVYDIDDLQQVADANMRQRQKEAELAEEIVEEEVDRMLRRLKSLEIAPTIVSLNQQLEQVRKAEIERWRSKLGDLTPQQEQAIEALTRGLIGKIAHTPITQMKELSHHPDGLRFVEFVKRAFNLRHHS